MMVMVLNINAMIPTTVQKIARNWYVGDEGRWQVSETVILLEPLFLNPSKLLCPIISTRSLCFDLSQNHSFLTECE